MPDDPQPVTEEPQQTARLPIAVVIPHAGLALPPEVAGRVALSAAQIFNEADAYADLLYDFRGRVLHWVCFPYARAVVDVNRPDDPARTRPGDGIVKRQTSYGAPVFRPGLAPDAALERQLIARYWQPWHAQLAAIAADPQVRLVIDAHSMAATGPTLYDDPAAARPRVSVSNLGRPDGTAHPARPLSAPPELARQLAAALAAALADLPVLAVPGREVAINQPFYGGWDLWAHGGQQQPWCMVEVNRALYVGQQDGETPVSPPRLAYIEPLQERLWQGFVAGVEGVEGMRG